MKKCILVLFIILLSGLKNVSSQVSPDTSVYLITCAAGTETYSIYGHSALRIVISSPHSDIVYNWGVFDFDTPNFAWKFAKGRLDYMLDESSFNAFMQTYLFEKRSVYLQKINLDSKETKSLIEMIKDNLKPENIHYRYDFFYDDCSTRIRDLIEKAVGDKLIYPPEETSKVRTFREKTGEYQKFYPWLKMGIDLIMGTPGDKSASFRERMFLPIDLQHNLTQIVIKRDKRMISLLQPVQKILEFDAPRIKQRFYDSPIFVFTLVCILIIFLSVMLKSSGLMKILDILIFSIFSLLSVLMLFFNFFTDHQQMKMNINIIWFNPIIIICLLCLFLNKPGRLIFRLVFYLSLIFIPIIIVFPNAINISLVPVIFILILRSSARADFTWNPLSANFENKKRKDNLKTFR